MGFGIYLDYACSDYKGRESGYRACFQTTDAAPFDIAVDYFVEVDFDNY